MSMPAAEADANSIAQPATLCAHCMGHSDLPAKTIAAVASIEQSKRDLSARISAHVSNSLVSSITSFSPQLSSRPHAPPGTSVRRHVLVSTFLI